MTTMRPTTKRLPAALLVLLAAAPAAHAQPAPLRRTPSPGLDVVDYRFGLALSAALDRIDGTAVIRATASRPLPNVVLDLVEVQPDGSGMRVASVGEARGDRLDPLRFEHRNGLLTIERALAPGDTAALVVTYGGVPKDGLVLATNRHGDRTAFGDNWPMRARFWLPTHDHLSDKATVSFHVSHPASVQVVANGRRADTVCDVARRASDDVSRRFVAEACDPLAARGIAQTVYRSDVPLPTKVTVIGAAPFAVQTAGVLPATAQRPAVPVESWVFPQDSAAGFHDYALAVPIAAYFDSLIAPYPFEKLANVQSKTIYGGMENAGAIFYHEGSVTGDRASEALLAHEIAHQWFGNGATEADWPHLWLSEGFATYLTEVWLEHRYGTPRLRENLTRARTQVVGFLRQTPLPLVDTVTANVPEMLTANPYQRGAWVLHQLRRRVGDAAFFDALRRYYAAHGYRRGPDGRTVALPNATTDDFRRAVEAASGEDLRAFFQQWTRRADVPRLSATLRYDARRGEALVTIRQHTAAPFDVPLTLGVDGAAHRVQVRRAEETFRIPAASRPARLVLDPDVDLLFEEVR